MAKQNKKNTKKIIKSGLDTVSHMARDNLERLGGYIDDFNAKSTKASKFDAVDLSKIKGKSTDNSFAKQTIKNSQQLLGPRVATYGKYAKKVVPDSIFQKASDTAFTQVAKLAATWSQIDLPNEHRFADLKSLDTQQRNALAQEIANQNRALALLGGVTGLAGLPGMIADTLWLLLVSLRSVYQLATVYDQPLTGKKGVKMAYAVLSNADLSKTQEKQAMLAGLSVAKGLLENSGLNGITHELENMGVSGQNVKLYADKIEEITNQFDIPFDVSNLSWLTKLLPITSVAISTYYNSQLIDQVIGTANATFGPEPIAAKKMLVDSNDKSVSEGDSDSADTSEADADKADADKADADKADADKADADKADADKADTDKADTDKADTDKADTDKADADKADADKADADKADADKADADKADADKADADKADADKAGADKANADKVDADKVDADKVDADKVDADKVDADKE